MRSDSPPAEWYEPQDLVDDDHEPEPTPIEPLVIAYGWATWTAAPDDDA